MSKQPDHTYRHMIVLLAIAAAFVGLALFLTAYNADAEEHYRSEWIKWLLQTGTVVVGGTVLKLVLDGVQDRRRRADERASSLEDFRVDKLKRVVAANNEVRRAQTLVPAFRTLNAYREQYVVATKAALDLRAIRHEIAAGASGLDEYQDVWEPIRKGLREMQCYLDGLNAEFISVFDQMAEMERAAAEQPEDVRAEIQRAIWHTLSRLPGVEVFITTADGSSKHPFETGYNTAYRRVIGGLVSETLGKPVARKWRSKTREALARHEDAEPVEEAPDD